MHVGQELSARIIDENYFIQHNSDLLLVGASLLPASFEFLDPGPGKPSFQFEYRSPCVRIRRDFQHGQMAKPL